MSNRFSYIRYDEKAAENQQHVKTLFESLEGAVEGLPNGRAKSLILTKLEEAYMWCGKAIRDDQIARTGEAPEEPRRGEE